VTKRATVLFTRGSNELTVAAKNTLDALIGVLRNAEVKQLTVTGYASAEWSSQPANALTNNDALARRRAMIVSDYLRSSISGLDVQQRSAVNLSDAAEQSRSAVISYQI
jgi:outer membrane protein OmpA-like peptidoglycan-associated protein